MALATEASSTETSADTRCGGCGQTLPLRESTNGPAQVFLCTRCGKKARGVLVKDAPPELLGNVRLAITMGKPPAPPAPPARSTGVASPDRSPPPCPEPTRASGRIDRFVESRPRLNVELQGKPFLAGIEDRSGTPYDPDIEQELGAGLTAATAQIDAVVEAVERGDGVDTNHAEAVTRDTLTQATRDLDLFVKLGVNPTGVGYPGRHSLHTAMLATAIGARLGWDRETIVHVGVGCMIHDLGMVKVPDKEYEREETLDDLAFSQIAAHPIHTFDLIEDHLDTVPLATRMVAYQIHERCNGTGYPRKRRAALIHEASKVAAVADVFVALVSPRPHRKPLVPYYAMEHLIRASSEGRFDADAIRALLRTVSLFPIGSYVELTDERVGRVIRSNPEAYCRPLLEVWGRENLDAEPTLVDLSKVAEIAVRRPLESLEAA